MEINDSEALRSADTLEAECPTPPELHIAAWSDLIKSGAVTAPSLLGSLKSASQRASDGPSGLAKTRDVTNTDCARSSDFYRRACWAPDGSVLLAATESQRKHIISCSPSQSLDASPRRGRLERKCDFKSPTPLLDAIWYPVPALEQPTSEQALDGPAPESIATWCFAESHRDLPIRLTSSKDGSTRASYSIMNHVEKFVGPHSLVFSPDLSRLYCGLVSALAVFPLSRPGLNSHSLIPLTSGKRTAGGQRGIISALAAAANPSEPTQELIAVGTFGGTVAVYGFDPAEFPEPTEHTAVQIAANDAEPLAQRCCLAGWREIEGDGITQLKFHPLNPYVLFVASRRSDTIYVYDIRYLIGDTSRWSFRPLALATAGVRSAHLLARLHRPGGSSNQRLYFDVDWAGRWLATGDQEGMVHMWRIDAGRFADQVDVDAEDAGQPEALELMPDLSWKAHQDAVGSVFLHPYQPWLASVSGSRRWPNTISDDSSDSEEERDSQGGDDAGGQRRAWTTNDSSLKVWDFSDPPASPS